MRADTSQQGEQAPVALQAAALEAVRVAGADSAALALFNGARPAGDPIASQFGATAKLVVSGILGQADLRDTVTRLNVFRSDDAASDTRVPNDIAQKWRAAGVRSVLVVSLRSREGPLGILGVSKAAAEPFSAEAEARLIRLGAELRQTLVRSERPGFVSAHAGLSTRLTPREREIVKLLAADKTCKEVAAVLELSSRTVEHYIERLKLRHHQTTIHGLIGHLTRLGLQ